MAYLPLSTANLPDPVIDPAQGSSPEDYFNTALYTGTGSQQSITGVGFAPDFTWFKGRSIASNNHVHDSVRGSNLKLTTDSTAVEAANTGFESLDSDGFTVNSGNAYNNSGSTYVAWNWKANGSGVSNTDGSIPSTVSANTESGFSVITWTGNATLNADIGHGLASSPEMIIVKNRSATNSWIVQHHSVTGYLTLNGSGAVAGSNVFTPSDTTIEFDSTWDAINGNGNLMLCYAFHSAEGFSKFGSYTGNGSADGPFVYTGFRPAFVMFKKSSGTGDWNIRDTSRSPYNVVGEALYPNLSFVEYSGTETYIDILSNGFKLRGNWNSTNASGGTYIYACFSENPFKYSNAR